MSKIQEAIDKHPALKALGSGACVCGQPKRRKQYFCRGCWRRLRGDIRFALRELYAFHRTEEIYRLALAELKAAGRIEEEPHV